MYLPLIKLTVPGTPPRTLDRFFLFCVEDSNAIVKRFQWINLKKIILWTLFLKLPLDIGPLHISSAGLSTGWIVPGILTGSAGAVPGGKECVKREKPFKPAILDLQEESHARH
jgi:hypothetical protein